MYVFILITLINIRLAERTAVYDINFPNKIRLCRLLAVSVLLYGCKGRPLSAATTEKIQAFETNCFKRLLLHTTDYDQSS